MSEIGNCFRMRQRKKEGKNKKEAIEIRSSYWRARSGGWIRIRRINALCDYMLFLPSVGAFLPPPSPPVDQQRTTHSLTHSWIWLLGYLDVEGAPLESLPSFRLLNIYMPFIGRCCSRQLSSSPPTLVLFPASSSSSLISKL